MKTVNEVMDKLNSISNYEEKMNLIFMWVKQNIISKNTFVKVISNIHID
jgi:hypothetical protein